MKRFALVVVLLAGFVADAAANRFTDFFRAIAIDNDQSMRVLLDGGIDPNLIDAVRNEHGLLLALRADADRVFTLLLKSPEIQVNVHAANGDTPLMLAAYKGKLAAVQALLDKHAQVNQPGWTALHYAAAVGHADIVRLLLEHHAYIDAASPNRTTPLMMAARDGHAACVTLLLDEGADATLRNEAGLTALDFAREHQHRAVADMLRAHGRKR